LLLQIPDEAGALGLLQARNNALRDLERTKLRAEDISDSIRVIDQSLKSLVEDLDRCSIAASEKARSRDATARCSEAANSARSALCKFRSQLVCAYCTELEAGFRQSFQALLEKKDLFDAVRIKPTNSRASAHFKVVFEICGREVQSIRFSAAERQMLTLALLWTLVRASGRRAPLVIDTPLARLDQIHRANVANGYVRHARDQLIALATDADYEVLKTSNEIARIIGLAETAR
jgi:DNA sulfur modification protein DndD